MRLIDADALCKTLRSLPENFYTSKVFANWIENHIDTVIPESNGQRMGDIKPCKVCSYHELEKGDTLYKYSSWDGGIGFDYIHNIQFCPCCGRELPNNFLEEEQK